MMHRMLKLFASRLLPQIITKRLENKASFRQPLIAADDACKSGDHANQSEGIGELGKPAWPNAHGNEK
jgi:hypothetical protein